MRFQFSHANLFCLFGLFDVDMLCAEVLKVTRDVTSIRDMLGVQFGNSSIHVYAVKFNFLSYLSRYVLRVITCSLSKVHAPNIVVAAIIMFKVTLLFGNIRKKKASFV